MSQVLQGAVLLCTVLVVAFCLKLVVDSKRARLSDIPGPFLAHYTDAWRLYEAWQTYWSGYQANHFRPLQKQYGDVIRTGPRSVTVLDPAAVPVIYGVRSKLNKGDAYLPFRQTGVTTSLLSIQDEKVHSQYRKVVANAYSMSSLKGYEPYVDTMVTRFVEVCDRYARSKEPMNISLWCTFYCFDVVSKLSIGTPLGFLEGKDAFGLHEKVKSFGAYVSVVSQMPWLHKIFRDNLVMRRTKPSPFLQVVQTEVEARLAKPDPENQPRPDLLSHFVFTHGIHPDLMTRSQIAIMASGNLIAGSLSPAKAFDEFCRFLAAHPDAQEKLYEELTQAKCTYPAAYDQVKNLPYLEGVIKEALRLHSSTSSSFNLQRVTGPAGLNLPNGVFIPANINVGCPAACINKDSRVFGPDANVYKPERWMQGEYENVEAYEGRRRLMERTDLAFGQGSRKCIGIPLFDLEVYKAAATLVGLFKFEMVGKPQKDGVFVSVHRREKT